MNPTISKHVMITSLLFVLIFKLVNPTMACRTHAMTSLLFVSKVIPSKSLHVMILFVFYISFFFFFGRKESLINDE